MQNTDATVRVLRQLRDRLLSLRKYWSRTLLLSGGSYLTQRLLLAALSPWLWSFLLMKKLCHLS